jgi:periplasmic protein TonB
MFSKLVASGPARRRVATRRSVLVSVGVHGVLLVAAAYATTRPPAARPEAEEEVTFLEVEETAPEPPAPPPPPPPMAVVTPPPAKGFQELIPPEVPPAVIPPPDNSAQAVDARDFSGLGVAGGRANGVEGGVPEQPVVDSTFAYEVGVLDEAPRLANLGQVQSLLQRYYPRLLQDAGISGTVMMQFVITPDGKVDASTVKVISSTHEDFSGASVRALERFRFRPGRYRGESVRVLIQMPISWVPAGR